MENLASSLESPITFGERLKVTSAPIFVPDFNLLSCDLDYFTFKVLYHSHKRRKDSLDLVLFAAELESLKIVVPRLPQNTLNVKFECAEKLKWLYSLCDHLFLALIYLYFFCSDINLFLIDYAWC